MSSARLRAAAIVVAGALVSAVTVTGVTAQADGHLGRILEAGTIRVATDDASPPNSAVTDGQLVGFDVDVANEIAQRLGVDIEFETPSWPLVEAGSWGGRWDLNVGSMTTTSVREEVVDFSQPYLYETASMAAHADLGYQAAADLAGQAICTTEASAFADWIDGSLDLGERTPEAMAPAGSTVWAVASPRECPEAWDNGDIGFQGWLAAAPDVARAIEDGLPVVALGEPVFQVPMAVAFDRSVEDNDSLVAAVDRIIESMRRDGTLSALSVEWFGEDRTMQLTEESDSSG